MISALLSRIVILTCGTLYPAYASYKAVRTKDVKEYVKWMMYWIVFALFTCAETFTDIFLSFWFPFYYETKIILVLYLLSPATRGSSLLYKKFVHPLLIKHEEEIDEYIAKAKEQGYHTVLSLGSKGVNYATTILMQTAIKGGGGLVSQIRKSYSLADLPASDPRRQSTDETDDIYPEDDKVLKRRRGRSPRRTASSGGQVDMFFNEVDVRDSPLNDSFLPSHIRSSEDVSSGCVTPDGSRPRGVTDAAKDRLVRTSSVSSTSRVRTRAAARAERTSSLADEWDDASDDLQGESQPLPPSVSANDSLEPPAAAADGNVLLPLVNPHLQFLFSNLSPAELSALVQSATAAVTEIHISTENDKKALRENLLPQTCGQTEEERTEKEVPVDSAEIFVDALSKEDRADEPFPNKTSETVPKVIKRPKKRQAPVPPMGGSLIDLHRLSALSTLEGDGMEVSSVMDLELSSASPSPNCSTADLNKHKTRKDASNFSKMLQLPFNFWQKDKHSLTESRQLDGEGSRGLADSFISLHEDPPNVSAVREMSQSPFSKRRHAL